jgi:hypothetical protein
MDQLPYHLSQVRREAVLGAIQEVCAGPCVHPQCSFWSSEFKPCLESNHARRAVTAESDAK